MVPKVEYGPVVLINSRLLSLRLFFFFLPNFPELDCTLLSKLYLDRKECCDEKSAAAGRKSKQWV